MFGKNKKRRGKTYKAVMLAVVEAEDIVVVAIVVGATDVAPVVALEEENAVETAEVTPDEGVTLVTAGAGTSLGDTTGTTGLSRIVFGIAGGVASL